MVKKDCGQQWYGMSVERFDVLCKYVWECAKIMNLRDWTLSIHKLPFVSEKYAARVTPIDGQRQAKISFANEFETYDDDRKRYLVAHELTHLHFAEMALLLRTTLPRLIGDIGYGAIQQSLKWGEERAVDALAETIALALPPYPPAVEPSKPRRRPRRKAGKARQDAPGSTPPAPADPKPGKPDSTPQRPGKRKPSSHGKAKK